MDGEVRTIRCIQWRVLVALPSKCNSQILIEFSLPRAGHFLKLLKSVLFPQKPQLLLNLSCTPPMIFPFLQEGRVREPPLETCELHSVAIHRRSDIWMQPVDSDAVCSTENVLISSVSWRTLPNRTQGRSRKMIRGKMRPSTKPRGTSVHA